jgi:hypothetical protein
MRRAAFALAAAGLLAAAGTAQGVGQATRGPQLRLLDSDPVMVRATGFHAREHVRLVVRAPGLIVRNATAGTGGGFTMRLGGVSADACQGFSVIATGDEGSRAMLKRPPGQCAQP